MRVALISDIQGNLPALEAVLDHASKFYPDAIWNLGDAVGYGAQPDQVIRLLRRRGVISVRGDFENRVLKIPRKKAKWREKKGPDEFLALYWAFENLTPPSRDYLKSLPKQLAMRMGDTRLLLVHGSPASRGEALTRGTPAERLEELLDEAGARILCCGHSLEPFFRKINHGYTINPGSVGRQNDGDPRASYALLGLDPGMLQEGAGGEIKLDVRHFRVAYDLDRATTEIRKRGLPETFAQMLIQGRDLPTVMRSPETWEVPEPENQSWLGSVLGGESRQEKEEEKIRSVIALAEEHAYPADHVQQTTHLALRLFDELQPLHRLGPDQRFWLRCGSLLHDIGKGKKNHHLKALKVIINSDQLALTDREKAIVGSIARYHRREKPREKHDHLAGLPVVDQRSVTILSSILRVADGLDTSPRGNVVDLDCSFSAEEITIRCRVKSQAEKQKRRALGKGELLEFAFDRELFIEWHQV